MLEHSWLGYCGCCLGKMSQSDSIFKILRIPYHTKLQCRCDLLISFVVLFFWHHLLVPLLLLS